MIFTYSRRNIGTGRGESEGSGNGDLWGFGAGKKSRGDFSKSSCWGHGNRAEGGGHGRGHGGSAFEDPYSGILSLLRVELSAVSALSFYCALHERDPVDLGECPQELLDALSQSKEPEYVCMAFILLARLHPSCPKFRQALDVCAGGFSGNAYEDYYLKRLENAYEYLD